MATPGWSTRRFYRIFFESPVVLRINRIHRKSIRLAEKDVHGRILNLSEGGCGVESQFFIPKGTRVNLFIDRAALSPKDSKQVEKGVTRIVGQVMNCAGKGLGKYRLGLEFVRMASKDRHLVSQMVQIVERGKHPRLELGR